LIAKFVIAGRRFNPGGWLHKINKLKLIQGVSNWFGSNAGSNWGIGSGCLRQKLIHLAKLASGFPFGFLVNVLVDVLREPDARVSNKLAITFSGTPWARGAKRGRPANRETAVLGALRQSPANKIPSVFCFGRSVFR
jgi:hypothetical protein